MSRNYPKPQLKKIIWEKTRGICAYCGKAVSGNAATIDHFIPKSMDGGYDQRNLMPLCSRCNKHRMNRDIEPSELYSYASEGAIQECLEYKAEWTQLHTNLCGEKI